MRRSPPGKRGGEEGWREPLESGRALTDFLVMSLAAGGLLGFVAWFLRTHGHYADDVNDARTLAGALFLGTGFLTTLVIALVLGLRVLQTMRGYLRGRAPALPGPAAAIMAYGVGVTFLAFLAGMALFFLA